MFNNLFHKRKNDDDDEKSIINLNVANGSTDAIKKKAESIIIKNSELPKYDRKSIDNSSARNNLKKQAFDGKKTIIDPYSKEELCLTKKEAIERYGKEYMAEHLAEVDHIVPLEKIA